MYPSTMTIPCFLISFTSGKYCAYWHVVNMFLSSDLAPDFTMNECKRTLVGAQLKPLYPNGDNHS